MANNADNIRIWKDAEVWIATELEAVVAPDGTFGAEWAHVGLLNGGSEIGQEFDTDRVEVPSWGGKIRVTDQNFKKDSRSFAALEDNATTFGLIWPDSTFVETGSTVLRAPRDATVVVAFKTVDQKGRTVIDITREPANVYPTGQAKSDEGASATEFTVEVLPDSTDSLYDRLIVAPGTAIGDEPEVIRIGAGTP